MESADPWAAWRATGSELRTRKSLIRLDFIEHKSERSVMPQDTGLGRNVVLDGLDFASLRRVWEQAFGAAPPRSLSRVFMRCVLAYEHQCRVREWNGRTYQVEVIDNGYRFDGKTYPSLTTSAKRITGTHWSGPRFFGLTPKRKA